MATSTVIGFFANRAEAESSVRGLVSSGFARDQISIVSGDAESKVAPDLAPHPSTGSEMGAGAGAAVGGVAGFVVGMLALAIPGIGPAIAAGPLAAAIVGASVGAAAGGLIGALTSIGVPEEDARRYSEGIRRGGMLVAVHTNDALADLASGVLERNGAQDIDERSAVGSDAPLAQDHGLDPGEFQDKRSSRAVRSYTRVS